MIENKLFNSNTELLLRSMLVLSKYSNLNIDQIAEIDFKATYGFYFGIADENLHGDNEFGLQEYSLRRKKISDAVMNGALRGVISYKEIENQGYLYALSSKGNRVISKFDSEDLYFTEYRKEIEKIDIPAADESTYFLERIEDKLWVRDFEE